VSFVSLWLGSFVRIFSRPLRRTKGGAYYGETHLNLHGACDEAGNNDEGIMIFRVAVDAEPAAGPTTKPGR